MRGATGSGTERLWKAEEVHQLYRWIEPEAVTGQMWETAMKVLPAVVMPWRGERLPLKVARVVPVAAS